MSGPLEEQYFDWLCAKVSYHPRLYSRLLEMLHRTEFVWVVSGDKNRAADGIELRHMFALESNLREDPDWSAVGCSLFEMLLAFAQRAEFQTDMSAKDWFWVFIQNLGLDEYRVMDDQDVEEVEDVLYRLVWRLYDSNGNGGLFPIRWPQRDQKGIEIWYQFCDYVNEQRLV